VNAGVGIDVVIVDYPENTNSLIMALFKNIYFMAL
jgi:hypothetical protein